MGYGSLNGFARASRTDPVGAAKCDRCSFVYNRTRLVAQFQWSGSGLVDTGLRVCHGAGTMDCLDVPFEQYRALILPGDPEPVPYPRPDPDITPPGTMGFPVPTPFAFPLPTDPYNQGFTPFQLGGVPPAATPWNAAQGTPQPGGFPPGAPTSKAAVLASVAAVSGVQTPNGGIVVDQSIIFTAASATQPLIAANANRQWLLMYSPVAPMSGFSQGSAILGSMTTLMFGPGAAWFWATAQGLGGVTQSAMTAVGLVAGMPLWCWEYPVATGFVNDGGVLILTGPTAGWSTSQVGLGNGAFWSNGGVASVMPLPTYVPGIAPVVFGGITASRLLTLGSGVLPWIEPTPGSGILWLPGGPLGGDIWVA